MKTARIAETYPLTPMQEGILFHALLVPDSDAYITQFACELGGLNPDAFVRAWQWTVDRHAVLRTAFTWKNLPRPVQAVGRSVMVKFHREDWRDRPAENREADFAAFLARDRSTPFALHRAPLARFVLLRFGDEEYRFVWTHHHLLLDGWSVQIVLAETLAAYAAFVRGDAPAMPAPPPFREYVNRLERRDPAALEPFWRGFFAGFAGAGPIGTRDESVGRFAEETVLDASATARIGDFARRHRLAPNTVFQGMWALLLARYAGAADVGYGVVVSGRAPEADAMVGLLTNTLPMRVRCPAAAKVSEWLGRLQLDLAEVRKFEATPLARVRAWTDVPRDGELFESVFVFENYPVRAGAFPSQGPTLGRQWFSDATDLPVSLTVVPGAETTLKLAGNNRRFGPDGARGVLRHYVNLLADLSGDRRLDDLAMLAARERETIVVGWNATERVVPFRPLHEQFEACAARSPEATAVLFEDERLDYGELNRRANRLARALRARGVGLETTVGVRLERSVELVVALLAALKAGAAYVPLDPENPDERLDFMTRAARASVVVTTSHLAPTAASAPLLLLDREDLAATDSDAENLGIEVFPDNAAYVIFTSGSTGFPKGVVTTHAGVANRIEWMQTEFGLTPSDRVLQKTPFGFDVSVWEFFWPLATGATLAVARPGGHRDPAYLAAAVRRYGVTTLHFVPAMLETFLSSRLGPPVPGLKRVICSGEALSAALRDRFHRSLAAELHNLYGPTEAAIDVSHWPCGPDDGRNPVPIGRPISNLRLYVLDPDGRPVPVGVAGELYIGGIGLARGYADRPDLTAERFVPDHLSGVSGGRLYRTGDAARFDADGAIVFLGRRDGQVKLRGVRIETGEIEAALARHPAVRQCLVVVREDRPGDLRLVAYVVGEEIQSADARRFLATTLPESMLPSAVVRLPAFPVTRNGKIDRAALPAPVADESGAAAPPSETERLVTEIWAEVLGVARVSPTDNFFDLGGHSLLLPPVQAKIAERFERDLPLVELFRFPTVRALAGHLAAAGAPRATAPTAAAADTFDIAVVGMAGRFPGAPDLDAFWRNLRDGVESIERFSDEELAAAGVPPELLADPTYVKAGAALEGIGEFDAEFFGMSPSEAELTDPQHRLFLECVWEALETAGYATGSDRPRIGVFAGTSINNYLLLHLGPRADVRERAGQFQTLIGSDKDFLATRAAYKLNLTGPSLTVQTACSTSLVAVHLACRSLLAGECEMAVAGGVSIPLPTVSGYRYQEGGILSPDGHCRAFDARAAGTVPGKGAGAVVLKPLAAALAAGDTVLAVVKGSAVNNDGGAKLGFAAPRIDGQAEVVRAALATAGVSADSISYVEAHGTGTPLGDPVEIAALTQVFRAAGDRVGFCRIGSVKTNIGHLDAAAGIAGFIKTVLAMRHGLLPPSLHFSEPNPRIDFAASPFRVVRRAEAWTADGGPRRAGISSFGVGGTNAHVVIEEPPALPPPVASDRMELFVLSARTESALATLGARLRDRLAVDPTVDPADVAFTLGAGRRAFAHRRAFVCRGIPAVVEALGDGAGDVAGRADGAVPPVVFLFPGQGSRAWEATAALYPNLPPFRAALDRCAAILAPRLGFDPVAAMHGNCPRNPADTDIDQPLTFAFEYALAQAWMELGVRPEAAIGHSLGEYVAACLAGVFSLEDALELTVARGRLMAALPPGAVTAVAYPADRMSGRLDARLAIAADNAPDACAVSGPPDAIADLEARLASEGVAFKRLPVARAFHSAMTEPMLDAFRAEFGGRALHPPRLPIASNVTGDLIDATRATSPDYWVSHVRSAVRFARGLAAVAADRDAVFLEIGTGRTLSGLVRRSLPESRVVPSVADRDGDGWGEFLKSVAALWTVGIEMDWSRLYEGRRRIPLPGHPFERRRHWIDPAPAPTAAGPSGRKPLREWFSMPVWKQSPPVNPRRVATDARGFTWLVFADDGGIAKRTAAALERAGAACAVVEPGVAFARRAPDRFVVHPTRREDYRELFAELARSNRLPDRIVHAWNLDDRPERTPETILAEAAALVREIGARGKKTTLCVATRGVHDVTGSERGNPSPGVLSGFFAAAALEYQNVNHRCVDFDDIAPKPMVLAAEALALPVGEETAHRAGRRWTRTYEPAPLDGVGETPFRDGGTYLITGGFGGIGAAIAEKMARSARVRLVLVTRTAPDGVRLEAVRALEALGAEVAWFAADVCDDDAMRRVRDAVRDRFGRIDGIVHAAGVAGGGVLAVNGAADDFRVLAPKIRGTLVLDRLFADDPPDFLILCSSLSAVTGAFGLSHYCAANSFQDAFAARSRVGRVTSVNWDRWEGVGMAGNAPPANALPRIHPLLDRLDRPSPDRAVFTTELSARTHWVLDEHRFGDVPVLPGAAYAEMARAATVHLDGEGPVEIGDLVLTAPLAVANRARIEIELTGAGPDREFTVSSLRAGRRVRHAAGRCRRTESDSVRLDLEAIRAACSDEEVVFSREDLDGPTAIRFGPRWKSLDSIRIGKNEGLATLRLADAFADDSPTFGLHPALLDLATGFAQRRFGDGLFVPVRIGRVRAYAPFPQTVLGHVRVRSVDADVLRFDATVAGADGSVLADIADFTLKRMDPARRIAADLPIEDTGMTAAEGVEAFERILAAPPVSRIVVSPRSVADALAEWQTVEARDRAIAEALPAEAAPNRVRPALSTAFLPPRDAVEDRLADIWRQVLGIREIGVADNFFELGGDSVMAIQVLALARAAGLDLDVDRVFRHQTVAELARSIDATDGLPSALPTDEPAETVIVSGVVLDRGEFDDLIARYGDA